jgi:putative acyl-CoA dehydrogenase
MVSMTRLDCVVGSAAGMRAALVQAVHHARHRSAFGGLLVDKPLMRNVLADLQLESEAPPRWRCGWPAPSTAPPGATPTSRRSSGSPSPSASTGSASASRRWWPRRWSASAATATSRSRGCPGCTGRAPLNSLWEGSGNVQALDVLRALVREPASLDAFFAELDLARGADPRLDDAVVGLRAGLADLDDIESRARRLVERMALALQGSLLVRHAPSAVADAFCASRLAGDRGLASAPCPAAPTRRPSSPASEALASVWPHIQRGGQTDASGPPPPPKRGDGPPGERVCD